MPEFPRRRNFCHEVPQWVERSPTFFITICCHLRGLAQLTHPRPFYVMTDALAHYCAQSIWYVPLFLAMPDHVHALISIGFERSIASAIRSWKGFVAKQTGIAWQDGFFEHRIRSVQSYHEKWDYIVANPVKRQLVSRPEDWPYVWRGAEHKPVPQTGPAHQG